MEGEHTKMYYHAKWKVNVPKCSKYHAKWQILVRNCCKYKADGTRKESQQTIPKPEPKTIPKTILHPLIFDFSHSIHACLLHVYVYACADMLKVWACAHMCSFSTVRNNASIISSHNCCLCVLCTPILYSIYIYLFLFMLIHSFIHSLTHSFIHSSCYFLNIIIGFRWCGVGASKHMHQNTCRWKNGTVQ
jgi:hypothetical protein